MYNPLIYKLPNVQDNIFETAIEPQFAKAINYPLFEYGFNHFIHQTKDKMELVNDPQLKNKHFYYVVNPFEHIVDKSDDCIGKTTIRYFGKKNPKIISRAFYKLWEILFLFDIVPLNNNKFTSVNLAEAPGAFIQAVIYYREKFGDKKDVKNDKIFGISLQDGNNDEVPEIKQEFMNFYKDKLFIHNKDNGDLTSLKTINNFYNEIKKEGRKANLVTADGGFVWKNENYQEQEMYKLLLGEIVMAVKVQEVGGNFVIKFFESYTGITLKYLLILQVFYDTVYIVKPLTSRTCNSEKYVVCMGFKKNNNKYIEILEMLLGSFDKGEYLADIFPSYKMPKEFTDLMVHINGVITNNQMVMINNIITYINNNNYYGEQYNKYRNEQILANKYWVDTYYPEVDNFVKAKELCNRQVQDILSKQ